MAKFFLLLSFLLVFCPGPLPAQSQSAPQALTQAPQGQHKRILILYSYGYNLPAQQQIAAGLQSVINRAKLSSGDYFHEYLDISPAKHPEQRQVLRDLLLKKYAGQRFDLIITVYDAAFDFLLHEGAPLSPQTPCFALFVASKRPDARRAGQKIIQIPNRFDLRGTLKLALDLFPQTRKVLFLSGSTPSNLAIEEQARADFAPWSGKIAFEYTGRRSVDELLQQIAHLPPETVVISTVISADATGKIFNPKDVSILLAGASNRPVFTVASTHLDTGVVGGSLVDTDGVGAMLGRGVLAMEDGKPLPVEPESSYIKPMFDWQQLERWGVDAKRLPPDSVFINRPLTLWSQYRAAVIGAIIVISFLSAMIVPLLLLNRQRKRAELSALQSEARFRVLIEQAPEAIIVFDVDRKLIVDANASAERLFGCGREELLQCGPQRFYPAEQPDGRGVQDTFGEYTARAIVGDEVHFERAILSADGRCLHCEVRLVLLPSGNNRQIRASFIDITERKRAEEAIHEQAQMLELEIAERQQIQEALEEQTATLEEEAEVRKLAEEALGESERRLRSLFDGSPIGMFRTTFDGHLLQANAALAAIYGFGGQDEMMAEVNRAGSATLWAQPGERGVFVEKVKAAKGRYVQQQTKLRRRDGMFLDTIVYMVLSTDPDTNETCLVGFLQDLTERKRMEEQLLQSQKMGSIGRLAGGIAHDFNNMLSVILGAAELSKHQIREEDAIWQYIDVISKAAKRSSEITRQLLAFSRKGVISPRPVDLNALLCESEKMLVRLISEDIKLSVRPATGLWTAMIDPSQIDQILLNLSANASDAMPSGGSLILETSNVGIDDDHCRYNLDARQGDYVQLSVSDSGTGMSRDILEHAFEPFFTTKGVGRGTGLGLATVYGIVTQNHGFIDVQSEPGKGTTFRIHFPRLHGEAALEEQGAATALVGSGTILVVEDEEMLLLTTSKLLEEIGYRIIKAPTPEDAIFTCGQIDLGIDLILTDVVMPGMNGRELVEKIRPIRPDIKVLFMSGYTADILSQRGAVDEGMHYIQKPLELKELDAKIKLALA
jgi:PAS domain S-box-containing protein